MSSEAIRLVMAEVSGEGRAVVTPEMISGDNVPERTPLAVSGSFKEGVKMSSSRRRVALRPSLDADDFMNLLHGSDPVKMELNRLENEVRGQSSWLDPLDSRLDMF